jgi:hypothetical protein
MTIDSIFLVVSAVGLTPIALSYGLVPGATLTPLFGFPVERPNLAHIFRAVMGLYLALVGFWIAGALLPDLTIPALWSLVIFMFGLAAGRVLSLLLDGVPHWLLSVYLVLEVGFGAVGAWLLLSVSP